MSFAYTCDWCGRIIDADQDQATLTVEGSLRSGTYDEQRDAKGIGGYVGHYHQEECWHALLARIELVHEHAQTLETIPTVSNQQVAARRRKHTKPTEDQR